MMSPRYDVLVVGAGPGGATCAWKCAERGLSVLLLDRAPSLPRYKPCGGGIPSSLQQHVHGLDPTAFADLIVTRLRHSWKGTSPVSAEMTRANGAPAEVWMVQRPRFDAWLVDQARRHGASVRIGAKVSGVTTDADGVHLTLADGTVETGRVVVGADGARGVVGPRLGLRLGRRYGIAREMEIPFESADSPWHPMLEPAACYLDYGTVRNGYAWIFPKAGCLSVGAGMLLPSRPSADAELGVGRTLLRAIVSLLESVGLAYPDGQDAPKLWGHPIPFWTGTEPLATEDGRGLLVGDAAGVVQPLFGEGIQYAVRSGAIAADCIATDAICDYNRRIRDIFANEFDAASRVGRVFHRAPFLSYQLGVKNPAGTRLVGRLMAGDATLSGLEQKIYEKLKNPLRHRQ
jgi:geranylgeranyl reductase family protein